MKEGASPQTARYSLIVLRIALNKAVRWGLVAKNAASMVDAPRVERVRVQTLTPVEARRLLDTASGDRLAALFAVALALGLRLGEALGLTWSGIDFGARTIRIENGLQRIDGLLQLVPTKTDRSRRTVAMPEMIALALQKHRVGQKRERLALGARWIDQDFVFTTTAGTPCDPDNVRRTFGALLLRAGIEHVRFHDLRHSAASLLLAPGGAGAHRHGNSASQPNFGDPGHVFARVPGGAEGSGSAGGELHQGLPDRLSDCSALLSAGSFRPSGRFSSGRSRVKSRKSE